MSSSCRWHNVNLRWDIFWPLVVHQLWEWQDEEQAYLFWQQNVRVSPVHVGSPPPSKPVEPYLIIQVYSNPGDMPNWHISSCFTLYFSISFTALLTGDTGDVWLLALGLKVFTTGLKTEAENPVPSFSKPVIDRKLIVWSRDTRCISYAVIIITH